MEAVLAPHRIASARREFLDRTLTTSERHLRVVYGEYTDHYNIYRPIGHCGRAHLLGIRLHQRWAQTPGLLRGGGLGGVIREFSQVA